MAISSSLDESMMIRWLTPNERGYAPHAGDMLAGMMSTTNSDDSSVLPLNDEVFQAGLVVWALPHPQQPVAATVPDL